MLVSVRGEAADGGRSMRLRTAILAGCLGLVAVACGGLFAVSAYVTRIGSAAGIDQVLRRNADRIAPTLAERRARRTAVLRAALATLTELDVQKGARDLLQRSTGSFVVVMDRTGRPLARAGAALTPDTLVRVSLEGRAAELGGIVYELVREPWMAPGGEVVGTVVAGHAFDDGEAAWLQRTLGFAVVLRQGRRRLAGAGLDPPLQEVVAVSAGPAFEHDGLRWRFATRVLVDDPRVEVQVIEPWLRRKPRYTIGFAVATAVAAGFAMLLALGFGRFLSRPIERLVDVTERIAAGDLAVRAEPRGTSELRTLAESVNTMTVQLERSRAELLEKSRLESELAIASRIQTAILPRDFDVPTLEVAARMEPASDVGGDYYDVLPVPGGAWFGIGDVAGHGIDAGLHALMAQTAIAAAVRGAPDAPPSRALVGVNRMLFANAWGRLATPRQMTLTLGRFHDDGRVRFAGAHQDLVVLRAGGPPEVVATSGTWVGIVEDIGAVTVDHELLLRPGDTLLLYSDGLLEAADRGVTLGLEQVVSAAHAASRGGPAAIVAALFEEVSRVTRRVRDDVTIVALRYRGEERAS